MATFQPSQSILFELLRSFTTLARLLNLSHAVKELNSTRQTVRRHITQLEELRGEALFEVIDRQYVLTDAGRRALPEATDLLARGYAWSRNELSHVGGLFSIRYETDPEFDYHLQQHPIGSLWRGQSALMQQCLRAWAAAGGEIEHEAMRPVRDYLLIYRKMGEAWLVSEIGELSAFTSWFGWAKARSSVGSVLEQMPGGSNFAVLLNEPFKDVFVSEGLRLDHIHTQIPREEGGPRVPLSFQRLMMGCRFPDGTLAIAAYVERSHDISIEWLDRAKIESMPEDLVMKAA